MNTDNVLKFFRSKVFVIIIIAFFGLALLVGAFTIGAFVGYKKAVFSYRWGENYHLNFGGPRGGFLLRLGNFGGGDFIEGHGTFGQIIKIDGRTLIVEGRDGMEKIVLIKDDTELRGSGDVFKIGDLKTNDYVVIIGEPNDQGQIEARFIRVMPSMPIPSMPIPTFRR